MTSWAVTVTVVGSVQAEVIPPPLMTGKINTLLQGRLEKKHQTQKFWYEWFGDLILARLWEELVAEGEES